METQIPAAFLLRAATTLGFCFSSWTCSCVLQFVYKFLLFQC